MNRILLVDDDAELREMLSDYLVGEGCEVGTAADGESGVPMALSGEYALVVLDVMMPGMGGIEALKRIRAESGLPVVMLTAKGEDMDHIVGLELEGGRLCAETVYAKGVGGARAGNPAARE